jgi:uncharacterized protein YbjT (DUF2867 family)
MATAKGRVLVAGASGGTGRAILDRLADTDYVVIATTRSEGKAGALSTAGAREIRVGDLTNPGFAETAVAGCDHVCCAVGTGTGLGLFLGSHVDGEGVCNLARAAADEGVDRFVLESAIGVGDSRPSAPLFLKLLMARVLSSKDRGEDCVRTADCTHTILRPGGLTDDPATEDVLVAEGGHTVTGTVPRADVARLMVNALDSDDAADRTFEIVSRDGLRGDATGVVDVDFD